MIAIALNRAVRATDNPKHGLREPFLTRGTCSNVAIHDHLVSPSRSARDERANNDHSHSYPFFGPLLLSLTLAHLVWAALRAISLRRLDDNLSARALPPFSPPSRPSSTAAANLVDFFMLEQCS